MSIAIEAPETGILAEVQYQMVNEDGVIVVCWRTEVNVLP
jgi:hypothetical protein